MRNILVIAGLLILLSSNAQKRDNYSFMKLFIENDNNQILLVKWKNEWELPGSRYNKPLSILEFLKDMSRTMGIEIESPKICGIYTQIWRGYSYLTIMHYYRANYKSGDLVIPEDSSDIGWFTHDEALELIPYENMKKMINSIMQNPNKVVSASFERYKDENGNTNYTTLEDWYFIND